MSKRILVLAVSTAFILSGCAGLLHNINPGHELIRLQDRAISMSQAQGKYPVVLNPKTWKFMEWYLDGGRGELRTIIERCWYWVPMMKNVFKSEGLPEELIYLPVIESEFITSAVSSKKASGPWQFMAYTGRLYGLQSDWWYDERRDPEKSTRAAALHLKMLYGMFKDWQLVLGAYNAGDGRINRVMKKYNTRDFWQLCRIKKAIPKETQYYVPKFAAATAVIGHMREFGYTNLVTCDPLIYDSVRLPDSTDLQIIAKCANTNEAVLHLLNPELKQWATPPITNYIIKVPSGRAPVFEINFNQIQPEDRITYRRCRIQAGDTISGIAHRYGVPQDIVISFNHIIDPATIVADHYLIIPLRGVRQTNLLEEPGRIETPHPSPEFKPEPTSKRKNPDMISYRKSLTNDRRRTMDKKTGAPKGTKGIPIRKKLFGIF